MDAMSKVSISATIEEATHEDVVCLAESEKRSKSSMINLLLQKGISVYTPGKKKKKK